VRRGVGSDGAVEERAGRRTRTRRRGTEDNDGDDNDDDGDFGGVGGVGDGGSGGGGNVTEASSSTQQQQQQQQQQHVGEQQSELTSTAPLAARDVKLSSYVASTLAARALGTSKREAVANALAKYDAVAPVRADEREIIERFLVRLNSHQRSST
jgi:hypothetical protein